MTPAPRPVLLFDADCPLCRRSVRWLIRRDRAARLRFADLGSVEGQAVRAALGGGREAPDSLIFVPDWSRRLQGPWHLRADGALHAFALLPRTRWATAALRCLPLPFLNAGYRVVAAARRRRGTARENVPFSATEQARMLG